MDQQQLRRLQGAFTACGATASPLGRRLCEEAAASPAVAELFSQFYRTISAEVPDVRLFLSGLHYLGVPVSDVDTVVRDWRETLLDYMLSQTFRPRAATQAPELARGAREVAAKFGGGLCLVEWNCGAGLNLLLDLSPVEVVGRYGLDPAPFDLTAPEDRRVLQSFFWPDQVQPLPTASLDIRQGEAETELFALLTEAYAAMPPGNTLLIMDAYAWGELTDPQKQQITWQVQHLAGHLAPHKPMAWVQAEPGALRLQTFGWADPEDREVRRLPLA